MKRIFISFDYTHDKNYRYLLSALAKNPRSDIEFTDVTTEDIQSHDVRWIKEVLAQKIKYTMQTLVIIWKYANRYHHDRDEIGERNWQ